MPRCRVVCCTLSPFCYIFPQLVWGFCFVLRLGGGDRIFPPREIKGDIMAAVRKTLRALRCLLAAIAAPMPFAPFPVAAAIGVSGAPRVIHIPSARLYSAFLVVCCGLEL